MALPNGTNGTKAFGGVIAVVALITGVMAIVRPMQQSIDNMKADFVRHLTLPAHPEAIAGLAAIREKFIEVETQFKNLEGNLSAAEKHLQMELKLNVEILKKELEWLEKEVERLGGKHP